MIVIVPHAFVSENGKFGGSALPLPLETPVTLPLESSVSFSASAAFGSGLPVLFGSPDERTVSVPSGLTVTCTAVAVTAVASTTVAEKAPAVIFTTEPAGNACVKVIDAWPFASRTPVPTVAPLYVTVSGVSEKLFVLRAPLCGAIPVKVTASDCVAGPGAALAGAIGLAAGIEVELVPPPPHATSASTEAVAKTPIALFFIVPICRRAIVKYRAIEAPAG